GDYIYTAGAFSASHEAVIVPEAVAQKERRPEQRRSDDSRVAHLHSPVDLNKGNMEFLIQHRFLGSVVRNGRLDTGSAFGVDFGANINLEIDYALTDRLSIGVSRARFDQLVEGRFSTGLVDFTANYELLTRSDSPWKFSLRGGIEGQENFERHYSGFLELASQFDYRFVRTYVVPVVVLNSRRDEDARARPEQAINPGDNHTFSLGVGVDLALSPRFSLVAEYVPRLAGFGGFGGERAAITGGVKIRTWGHVFHILLSNSRVFTPSQYAVNATTTDYALGFNIYRRIGH
ncbi:MAG: DUF5777 family beta-barrel protein, partial [Acidobacteriota bacterium]